MATNYFPPAGTDYVHLWTDAEIELAGGSETIEADGWFVVNRSNPNPDSPDKIVTQILQMHLRGRSEQLGDFLFSLNPQLPTMGEESTFMPEEFEARFEGHFNVYFQLELLEQGKTLINKDPVIIAGTFGALPPIGAVGEMTPGDKVAMYDKDNLDGEPVMYMLATRKIVGQYVTSDHGIRSQDYASAAKEAAEFAATGRIAPAPVQV